MSLKKTAAIAAAAGALAAVSVPAMALENEFHGSYTFNSIFSNFQYGGGGQYDPTKSNDHKKTNNYFEQRGRIQYTAKVSDDLKLVTHFELDTRFGGVTDGKYTNTSDAGVADADGISLETKWLFLDANLGSSFNLKTGIMPYKDTLKGVFVDADVPAVYTTTKLGTYTLGLGFARVSDVNIASSSMMTDAERLGDRATDLFIWDNTFAINKDTKAALSYYFLADYKNNAVAAVAAPNAFTAATAAKAATRDRLLLHTLGLSGETKLGALTLSGFAAIQAGYSALDTSDVHTNYHGWAANVAAKAAVGPGTAKGAFLFLSGDNNANDAQNRGWINAGVNSYNESGMMILARNTANSPTNTDTYLRRMVTNIALASLGYDANLSSKVYLNGNLGFAWVPSSKGAPVEAGKAANSSDFMGTELNLESGYKVSDNLTLRAQAAYALLGGYYKGSAANSAAAALKDPENPYTMRLLASFKF